jgi:hypothetical protein
MEEFIEMKISDKSLNALVSHVEDHLNYDDLSERVMEEFDIDIAINGISYHSCEKIMEKGISDSFAEDVFDRAECYVTSAIESKIEELVPSLIDDTIDNVLTSKVEEIMSDSFVTWSSLESMDLVDHTNVDDAIVNALSDYEPTSFCTMGGFFTNAVSRAVIHLLSTDDQFKTSVMDSLNIKTEVPNNAPDKDDDAIYPIFDPDFLALSAVVHKMTSDHLPSELKESNAFVSSLVFSMWEHFVNTRIHYINLVKDSKDK